MMITPIHRGLLFFVLLAIAAPVAKSAPDAPVIPTPGTLLTPIKLTDIGGGIHTIGGPRGKTTALVFVGTECPVSNRYLPQLSEMAKSLGSSVDLFMVISDPTVTRAAAAEYQKTYSITATILFDASGELAQSLKPTHTPEAFLISSTGELKYRGRIDDAWDSVARPNAHASQSDLVDAIKSVNSGKPVANAVTVSVGCVFEAWDKPVAASKYTYNRDVEPILAANCMSCHHAGEVAPFALTGYTDAAKRAKQIAAVTGSHFMPPWKPEDSSVHFVGERRLTERQIQILDAWAEAGAPEGIAADLAANPTFSDGWQLGKPDMVLTMAQPFDVPASGRDVYRAFVVPMNVAQNRFVAAVEFRAGAPTVVHHCILYLDDNGAARQLEKDKDKSDTQPGWRSFGGPGFPATGSLGGWAPGAEPVLLPDGVGRYVAGGSDVVFQIHYHPDGKPHKDQSSIGIYFTKKPVTHIIGGLSISNFRIDIPANASSYTRDASMVVPVDTTAVGIVPHMHLIGREMTVNATFPDGKKQQLISIKDWDFRWQDQYQFASAIRLPTGTKLDLHAVYDNSSTNPANPNSPAKEVKFGEQTTDEMCICFLTLELDHPADARILRQSVLAQRLGLKLNIAN